MTRLSPDFFARDTVEVARDLLGRVLVREHNGTRVAGRIIETEAYTGWDDSASHGHRGETRRNRVMFGQAGISYLYFIYGNYWLLNVIAKPAEVEYPAAVLIRAVEPLEGLEIMAERRVGRAMKDWTSGPGRLTLAMGIDQTLNHLNMTAPESPLYFEMGEPVPANAISSGPRIGLGRVPEPWRSQPWRFYVRDSIYLSA